MYKIVKIWGIDDFGGFGFLNFVFEGLVFGDKYGFVVGIVVLIFVVGGVFGIIMCIGVIDVGIYVFISKMKGLECLVLLLLFFVFLFGGVIFGMVEEVILFLMVMVLFVIVLGYDLIVVVIVIYVVF